MGRGSGNPFGQSRSNKDVMELPTKTTDVSCCDGSYGVCGVTDKSVHIFHKITIGFLLIGVFFLLWHFYFDDFVTRKEWINHEDGWTMTVKDIRNDKSQPAGRWDEGFGSSDGKNLFFHVGFIMDSSVGIWNAHRIDTPFFFDRMITYSVCCVVDYEFICMNEELFECKITRNSLLEYKTKDAKLSNSRCVLYYLLDERM